MEIANLYELGSFILLAGAVGGAVIGFGYLHVTKPVYYLMVLVPAVAALAYALMSLDVGFVNFEARRVNVVRYVDWLITTPLLLYVLSYVTVPYSANRMKTYLILVSADIVMLVAGLGAEFYSGITKIALFFVSALAYIVMLYVVIGLTIRLDKSRRPISQRRIALLMAWVILLLWSVYPFIWVFGTQGVAAIGLWSETVAYMVLDVTTKTGFVFLLSWFLTQRLERIKESA